MTDTAASGEGDAKGCRRGIRRTAEDIDAGMRWRAGVSAPCSPLKTAPVHLRFNSGLTPSTRQNGPRAAADLLPPYLTGVHYTPFRSQAPTSDTHPRSVLNQ